MPAPVPNLVGPETLDTVSTDGNCKYLPAPLGAGILVSPNVFLEKQPLRYSHAALPPSPCVGIKINPVIPAPCQPGIRVSINKINKTVFVNQLLPLVSGDLCQLAGTDRPFVGPFQTQGRVYVATKSLTGE